jgi:hypothetical protein
MLCPGTARTSPRSWSSCTYPANSDPRSCNGTTGSALNSIFECLYVHQTVQNTRCDTLNTLIPSTPSSRPCSPMMPVSNLSSGKPTGRFPHPVLNSCRTSSKALVVRTVPIHTRSVAIVPKRRGTRRARRSSLETPTANEQNQFIENCRDIPEHTTFISRHSVDLYRLNLLPFKPLVIRNFSRERV